MHKQSIPGSRLVLSVLHEAGVGCALIAALLIDDPCNEARTYARVIWLARL